MLARSPEVSRGLQGEMAASSLGSVLMILMLVGSCRSYHVQQLVLAEIIEFPQFFQSKTSRAGFVPD